MNKAIRQIKDKGYFIIEKLISDEECERYKLLITRLYNKYSSRYPTEESTQKFHDADEVKMVYNLHSKDISFFRIIDHPKVILIVKYLLQEGSYQNSEPFILKLSTARALHNKCKKQQLHVDSGICGSPFSLVVQTICALDDFTPENGSTRVVPGSHKRKEFAKDNKTYPDEVDLIMPKGSVVIYDGGLWHGSGEKKTIGDRWAIINTYARWFFRPSFDFNKNTPRRIYNKLTDFQKELLGFKFNPSQDEFTRLSRRSADFERPFGYRLPS